MLSLKLAFRGLWRHKLRTGITLGAVVFGHFLGLVFLGFNDGGHELMIEMGIRQGRAGHVVVQADGYQKTQAVELLLPQPERLRDKVLAQVPGARVVLRAFGGGLARTTEEAVGVMFAGVEPSRERHVAELADKIVRGVYLGADEDAIGKAEKEKGQLWCARPAEKDAPRRRQVVIGVQLAETLKLGLCDKLVLDAQGMGSRESQQLRVVGIFKTGNLSLDASFLHLRLEDVQQMLHLGEGVHQVAIFVGSAKRADEVTQRIREAIQDRQTRVLAWDEAMPEMAEFIWLDEAGGYIFMVILYIIVAIGVLNTVLMSVMERTREFGVMRAVGAGPWRIGLQVLAEGALIGVVGVLVGSLIAWPVIHHFETVGIDIGSLGEGSMEAGGIAMTVVKAKLYIMPAVWASLVIVAMAVVAAIYPAIRAARFNVLRAIGQV